MEQYKTCRDCKQIKELNLFPIRSKEKQTRHGSCRSCRAIYLASWHQQNRERRLEANRQRYAENIEAEKIRSAQKYQRLKPKIRETRRKWREQNKALSNSYSSKWRKRNPQVNRARAQRYRIRARGNSVYQITAKEIAKLCAGPCFYCGSAEFIQIDHVIPRSKGGVHGIGNLVSACRTCNSSKKDKFITEWRLKR